MLSAPSQVLLRNTEHLEQGHWLLVNPADNQIFTELSDCHVTGFHQYFDQYQACLNTQAPQLFAAICKLDEELDGAVIYLSKAKQHNQMLLANIAPLLKPGGQLLLVGENKAGIKSAGKLLEQFGQPNKLDSARHCTLFAVQIEKPAEPFDISKWQRKLDLTVDDIQFSIVTLPGVFSAEHLDPATELLLNNIESVPSGQLLDFACGAGPIGCYLGLKNTNSCITMCDVNALALYCAEQSAGLNDIDAKVIASNGLAELTGKFQAIYTNPPFHTGIKTDYKITQHFIHDAKGYLQRNGSLTLVANRFLAYPDLLQAKFEHFQVAAQSSKFNLYICR